MFTRVFLQHLMDEPIFVGISQGQGLYYYPFIFSHTNILFIKYSYFSNAQWPISHPKVQTQTSVLCWIWSQIQWNDYATVSTTYIVPRRKMKGISRKEKIYYWVWKENNILKIRNERTCWCVCVCVCEHAQSLSQVQFFVTPWTIVFQAPLSLGLPELPYFTQLLLSIVTSSLQKIKLMENNGSGFPGG